MTKEEIEAVIEIARANGCPSITIDGIEFKIGNKPKPREFVEVKIPSEELPTDEEILYWSTNYFDEIQAAKLAQAQRIKMKHE